MYQSFPSFDLRKLLWDVSREPVTVGRRNRFLKSEAEVRPRKVGTQIFLLVRKFLGSFRNRKSENFLDVPVLKSQIHKFVMINPQIANPQICESANPQFPCCRSPNANQQICMEKAVFLIQIRIVLPLKFFFTYVSIF
jgi:hypothetical protein